MGPLEHATKKIDFAKRWSDPRLIQQCTQIRVIDLVSFERRERAKFSGLGTLAHAMRGEPFSDER